MPDYSEAKNEFDTGAQSCFAILRILMSETRKEARRGCAHEKRKANFQLESLKELEARYKEFFNLGHERRTLLSDLRHSTNKEK